MNKSLAQFKRDIATGMSIEYVTCRNREYDSIKKTYVGEWFTLPVPEKMQGIRYVSYKDTTGFYLKREDDKSAKGSFCGWPKANELEYTGDTFTIVDITHEGEPYQMRHYKIIKFN